MYASGVRPSAAAAAGRPGTEWSKIQPQYSSIEIGRSGSFGLWKCSRIPRRPSGSISQDRSIQNSASSQTSPGFASQVRRTGAPARSIATRRTGWRKPIHCPACVSWLMMSWRSAECPIGST